MAFQTFGGVPCHLSDLGLATKHALLGLRVWKPNAPQWGAVENGARAKPSLDTIVINYDYYADYHYYFYYYDFV